MTDTGEQGMARPDPAQAARVGAAATPDDNTEGQVAQSGTTISEAASSAPDEVAKPGAQPPA